jgi:hypothetical protein
MNIRAAIYTFLVVVLPVTTFIFPTVMICGMMGILACCMLFFTYRLFCSLLTGEY